MLYAKAWDTHCPGCRGCDWNPFTGDCSQQGKWQQFFPFVAEEKCPLGLWSASVIFGQVWLYETRRGKKRFSHRLGTRIGKFVFLMCYSFVHRWRGGSTSNIQFPCSSWSFLRQTGTRLSAHGWVFVNYKGHFMCISCLRLLDTIL